MISCEIFKSGEEKINETKDLYWGDLLGPTSSIFYTTFPLLEPFKK